NQDGHIKRDISRLNAIRGSEPALHRLTNLQIIHTESDDIFAYIKRDDAAGRHLVVIVNLNPHQVRETTVHVPVETLGMDATAEYKVKDLLTGTKYTWHGAGNYVRLDPREKVGHLFR